MSKETLLRAMAVNYANGHRWDHLDGQAVVAAADEISALRASLEAASLELHRIMRTAEMSAGIMLDPQRTGNWPGARKTADAFDRIGLRAAETRAKVEATLTGRAALEQGS